METRAEGGSAFPYQSLGKWYGLGSERKTASLVEKTLIHWKGGENIVTWLVGQAMKIEHRETDRQRGVAAAGSPSGRQ